MTSRGGRICAACSLPPDSLAQLDVDLKAGGETRRAIAKRVGISEGALRRHQINHRDPALAALTAARKSTVAKAGDDMGDELKRLLDRCEVFLVAAEETGNASAAMAAIKELRQLWELFGRATGALKERPALVVNLVATEEWQEVRTVLFGVLQRHPAALAEVRAALRLEAAA